MAARAKRPVEQQPETPPSRLEVRMNGKVVFANPECYDVSLQLDGDDLSLTASLRPTLVDAPPPRPPERFGDDPRDGEEVLHQVHSGSRKQVAAPGPKE